MVTRAMTSAVLAVAALAAGAIGGRAPAEPPQPDLAMLLQRAGAYVAQIETEAGTIIADEQYDQVWTSGRRRAPGSGGTIPSNEVRRLTSELLFVWLPSERTWLAVRDVTRVDGRAVADADRPLKRLLQSQALISTTHLRDVLRENARYNLGDTQRNFNDPTFGLLPLDPEMQRRFQFTIAKGEHAGTVDVDFEETAQPTIVRGVGKTATGEIAEHNVPLRGTVSVDVATGAVVRTDISISDMSIRSSGRLITTFAKQPRFGFWLPSSMKEEYADLGNRDRSVRATARYSNYRRFETAGRLVIP